MREQLTTAAIQELEKQHYRIIGSHSAVKTCGWTKNMIRGEGGCYKLKFYGIMSNQCMQMTTSVSCANRCTFCWRGYKAPVGKEWKWDIDGPDDIFEKSVHAHHNLLVGFGGNETASRAAYEKSKTIKHVALSLTGEPITYPRMNELLERFNREGVSTFLVTNATYPEQIKNLKPVTQLYISLDAPEQELLKEVDKPLFTDYWERLNQSLEHLARKNQRTCIRLTMIKGINMKDPRKYAAMVMKGNPDFLEVKAYMHVGESRQRLAKENMPLHEEIIAFCKELVDYLPEYEIVSEHIPSRVVMFAKKTFRVKGIWHTWIDFPKWHQLVNSGDEFTSMDYLKRTPQTGLSGKGTLDTVPEEVKAKILADREVFVDEKTAELMFYNIDPWVYDPTTKGGRAQRGKRTQ